MQRKTLAKYLIVLVVCLGLSTAVPTSGPPATLAASTRLELLSHSTEIQRVSVASGGTQADDASYAASISGYGRYVAFDSDATNLVSGDTNALADVFVHDRKTGQTTRVSIASDGTQSDGNSYAPTISNDGRYVAFESAATNLVSGDTNANTDIFVHDRDTGQTTRVSVDSAGTQANGNSYTARISGDGRYVAFESAATNLVSGDTNGSTDIFVHDRDTGQTTRVSVSSAGTQANGISFAPSISSDGNYVAFDSDATNLVSGDTNSAVDVFVHNRAIGQTTRVSVASDSSQGNDSSYAPSISNDGRYVAFWGYATNLVSGDTNSNTDIFVHDRDTGQTSRASVASDGTQANNNSTVPSISGNGGYVTFWSFATNLVSGDTNGNVDVFVHEVATGETARVSVASGGAQSDGHSRYPSVSDGGRHVAFESDATNLVSSDTNGRNDIFVRDLLACPDFEDPAGVGVEDIPAGHWGKRSTDPGWDPRYDFDWDGVITIIDLSHVTAAFGSCP